MLRFTVTFSKDLKRLKQIINILSEHGLDSLLKSLNIKVPFIIKVKTLFKKRSSIPIEKRFRFALEELGTTFIKLGQMLSNRPDLIPESFINELDHLRDSITPISFDQFKDQIEKNLNQPVDEIFKHIETIPLATASLAQVHLATLQNGDSVVIKLQRPDVRKHIDTDLRLLTWLVDFILWRKPKLQQFQPTVMLKQLKSAIYEELDFRNEAKNARRFREMFANNDKIIIPDFYDEYLTKTINVQQNIPGIPCTKVDWLAQCEWDLSEHAKNISAAVIEMIFKYRCYHPDLHPGNVLLLSDGRVALVDFGSVGMITKTRKKQLLAFMESIITQDETVLANVLVEWNKRVGLDYDYLLVVSDQFVSRHKNIHLSKNAFATIIYDFLLMLRHADATLPGDLILLFKTLMCLDRLLSGTLQADFDFLAYIQPLIEPEIRQQTSPEHLAEETNTTVSAMLELRDESRMIIKRFSSDLASGRPFFKVDVPRIQSLAMIFDKLTSRISLAVIAASLIVGSAIITTVDKGKLILGIPEFGFYCFSIASIIGIWVIISIIRGVKSHKLEDILSEEKQTYGTGS